MSHKLRNAFFILPLLAILLGLTGCAKPILQAPGAHAGAVQAEQQRQYAAVNSKKIKAVEAKTGRRLDMEGRMLAIGMRVMKAGADICSRFSRKPTDCVYKLKLEEGGPPNASADGQTIRITPAMMRMASQDEELAFILAHEYSHNVLGHVDSLQTNAIVGGLVGLLADGLLASKGYGRPGEYTQAGMQLGARAYGVDFEREADYMGLYILEHAGYDSRKAPAVWRKLAANNPEAIYLSSTHPTTAERYVAMENIIREIRAKKQAGVPLYPNLKPQD